MRYALCFLLTWLALGAGAAFFPGTEDIPLADGIVLDDTADFSFDTPAGQILIFEGTLKTTPAAVRTFYADTLTALGWTHQTPDFFERAGDQMRISYPMTGRIRFDMTLSGTP